MTTTTQNDAQRVIIFDTTLRDGEQSPGAAMNLQEKLRIAKALEDLGVDVMEAGFPIASKGDFEAVNEIAKLVKNSTVCGLARAAAGDIQRAAEALQPAPRKRIHTFISTSPLHMKYKLQMEPEKVLQAVIDSVTLARSFCDDVEWSAEDGSRTEHDFLCRCVEAAIKAGARTINIPDTVGYSTPQEYAELFKMLIARVPNADKAIFSTHCHNDLGLAVANSLAGVISGARQVECTINGLGERGIISARAGWAARATWTGKSRCSGCWHPGRRRAIGVKAREIDAVLLHAVHERLTIAAALGSNRISRRGTRGGCSGCSRCGGIRGTAAC